MNQFMTAGRPAFWGIESTAWFYVLAFLALVLFCLGVYVRTIPWFKAKKTLGLSFSSRRLAGLLRDGLLGARLFRGDPQAGLMHLLILWGFTGLFIGTVLVSADHYLVHFLAGRIYLALSLALEICGAMLLTGVTWALVRRFVQRIPRLERRSVDILVPVWLMAVGLTGFLVEAARLAAQTPAWSKWSFLGDALAGFRTPSAAASSYPVLWWLHVVLSLALVAWLPWSKLFHALAAPVNLYIQDTQEPSMSLPDEADGELHDEPDFGRLVSLEACTRCGRCTDVCPSFLGGEPLSPRDRVRDARRRVMLDHHPLYQLKTYKEKKEKIRENLWAVSAEQVWYCTTCRACLEVCPVKISPLEIIWQDRLPVVEEGSAVPPQLGQTLETLYKYDNPWTARKGRKADWSKDTAPPDPAPGPDPEILYFVGCTTSLETRAQSLARSLAAVLDKAGVPFKTLGKNEPCCGDIALRLGELGLFEEKREKGLKTLLRANLSRIVTSSPHCWDVLRHKYPWPEAGRAGQKGVEVLHYSQILAELTAAGKLVFNRDMKAKATFHDPCYLARHNNVLAEPRSVLRAIPGLELVEMEAHGRDSLCCGGGGGRLWQELPQQGDLAQQRIRQAADTGADVLITACPLCLIMFEDARKTAGLEDRLQVMDLSELAARASGLGEAEEV